MTGIAVTARRSGKSAAMQKAMDDWIRRNPHATLAIFSGGEMHIEKPVYEVPRKALPAPQGAPSEQAQELGRSDLPRLARQFLVYLNRHGAHLSYEAQSARCSEQISADYASFAPPDNQWLEQIARSFARTIAEKGAKFCTDLPLPEGIKAHREQWDGASVRIMLAYNAKTNRQLLRFDMLVSSAG